MDQFRVGMPRFQMMLSPRIGRHMQVPIPNLLSKQFHSSLQKKSKNKQIQFIDKKLKDNQALPTIQKYKINFKSPS